MTLPCCSSIFIKRLFVESIHRKLSEKIFADLPFDVKATTREFLRDSCSLGSYVRISADLETQAYLKSHTCIYYSILYFHSFSIFYLTMPVDKGIM